MFFKRNLFACLHLFNNSFLLLRVDDLSEVVMKYFSINIIDIFWFCYSMH